MLTLKYWMKISLKRGSVEVVFLLPIMKHILNILEIIKWLTDVIIRHENYFTSFISYIFILYKCFYLIFYRFYIFFIYLFNDILSLKVLW